MVAGEFMIPIVLFIVIGASVVAALYFYNERKKHEGGGDYRRLAEEAVRGQQAMLAEVEKMNATLKEIARILKEV